jgi:hypothetical protein
MLGILQSYVDLEELLTVCIDRTRRVALRLSKYNTKCGLVGTTIVRGNRLSCSTDATKTYYF